ncbi:hypothetical protein B0T17DRAFT_613083 [Bombardia bombarda]|uniref:Uncharacterized protein n=1 Tax=Bombardia bombarda TaxID=252184 RepID=A0AA39XLX3_9PEZI|nr:hypothetical protein B0T17DRAFT_613083 [Bombardia bombarda]
MDSMMHITKNSMIHEAVSILRCPRWSWKNDSLFASPTLADFDNNSQAFERLYFGRIYADPSNKKKRREGLPYFDTPIRSKPVKEKSVQVQPAEVEATTRETDEALFKDSEEDQEADSNAESSDTNSGVAPPVQQPPNEGRQPVTPEGQITSQIDKIISKINKFFRTLPINLAKTALSAESSQENQGKKPEKGEVPEITIDKAGFEELSKEESYRVRTAFLRYELVTRLYGIPFYQAQIFRGALKADESRFLKQLHPRHQEELACIHEYVMKTYRRMLQELSLNCLSDKKHIENRHKPGMEHIEE